MARLTETQRKIYEQLSQEEGPIPHGDLAKKMEIKSNSMRSQLSILEKAGLVSHDDDGFIIIPESEELFEKLKAPPSLSDVKLMPKDYFTQTAKQLGLKDEIVEVITDYIWRQDPENLTLVWNALSKMNIAPDVRRQLWEAWRVYLDQPIPEELEETVSKTKTQLEKEEKDSAGGEKAEDRSKLRGWIVDDDGPQWLGQSLGVYTLSEAKELYALKMLGHRKTNVQDRTNGNQDSIANILTALKPYLSKDTDQNLIQQLLEERMLNMEERITSRLPAASSPKPFSSQITDILAVLGALKDAGPTIRNILGIPDTPVSANTQGPTNVVQLQNADGTPMQMNLNALLEIKKFEADERRQEESHRTRQEMARATKDFLGDIGRAAARMTQE